jgi:hypothetical protein
VIKFKPYALGQKQIQGETISGKHKKHNAYRLTLKA